MPVSRPGRPGTSTACGRRAPAWRPASRRRGTAGRRAGTRSGRRSPATGPAARARSAGRVVMIRPERRPARISVTRSDHNGAQRDCVEVAPGQVRIDAVAEEDLGPVHVADAGHAPPGPSAARRSAPGCGRCGRRRARRRDGVAAGRDRAGRGWRRPPTGLSTSHAVGPRRSVQPGRGDPAHAHGALRCRRLDPPRLRTCRTARGGRARCGRRRRRRGACRRPSRRRARARRRGRHRRSGPAGWSRRSAGRRTAPAGRAPDGAACDPPASVRRRPRCRCGRAGRRPRRTRPSARRRWRGRARSRSRTPGRRRRRGRARGSPVRHAGGAWPSMTTVGGPPLVHVSNPVRRAAQHPARRRRPPRPATRRGRTGAAATCSRICGWASPPIVPNTAASSPSRVAIAGHSVCGGRAPGRYSAGWPGARLNPSPRLCRLMPVVGSTSHDPKPAALDWIRLTASPEASAVHRYVVSPAAAANGRRPARCEVDEVGPGLDRGQQGLPVGRLVEHVGTVEGGGRRRLDEHVRPLRVVRIVGHADLLGEPGRAERQVALRVRADRRQLDAERRRLQRVDPVGLDAGEVVVGEVARRRGRAVPRRTLRRRSPIGRRRRSPARASATPGRRTGAPGRLACDASSSKRARASSSSRPSEPTSNGLAGKPNAARRIAGAEDRRQVEAAEALVQERSSRRRSRAR